LSPFSAGTAVYVFDFEDQEKPLNLPKTLQEREDYDFEFIELLPF
jgi:hypothetical protein